MSNEYKTNGYDFFAAIRRLVEKDGFKAKFGNRGAIKILCPSGEILTPTEAVHRFGENGNGYATSILDDLSPKTSEHIRQASINICCKDAGPEDERNFRHTRNRLLSSCGLRDRRTPLVRA